MVIFRKIFDYKSIPFKPSTIINSVTTPNATEFVDMLKTLIYIILFSNMILDRDQTFPQITLREKIHISKRFY